MALNPVVFTEKVLQSFLRYQLRAYPFADPRLHGQMRELLSLDEARESPRCWPGASSGWVRPFGPTSASIWLR